jgi:hypothetical protein
MRATLTSAVMVAFVLLAAGCNPQDRRPGLWLTGESAAWPGDWGFAADEKEIALEVSTPYLLPHSVTIWCATQGGTLYIGASAPESKRWPGWVDDDPDVRLGIAGQIYEARLTPLGAVADEAEIARLREVYAAKYQLGAPVGGGAPPSARYWRVGPRA